MWRLVIFLAAIAGACDAGETAPPEIYEGPMQVFENVEYLQTQDGRTEVILQAKKAFEFQNGNREMPEGIYVQFFDATGTLTSTIVANKAYYNNEDGVYRGEGDVVVKNYKEGNQLNTEKLYWNPLRKKIYTDQFATLTSPDALYSMVGFESNEDLSNSKFGRLTGEFPVEE